MRSDVFGIIIMINIQRFGHKRYWEMCGWLARMENQQNPRIDQETNEGKIIDKK